MVLPHKELELNSSYIILLSYYFCNELISVCVMINDKQHRIFLTYKSVRAGKLSTLAEKLSNPIIPRQFDLVVARKKKQVIKLKSNYSIR